ncbi:hypothetical protein G4D82_04990 [Flavobacterium sp. CYK-4]|uniref:hypothetical protein n=1 Tax=Flavobacterium lotistagni TaxID=2709660 RepID=UPI001407EDBF|nr:hypothetical protein [Flavobacterium lotistagni]NHM06567.1 hypothetical protein [Flavobacterium lotistagni]
MVRFLKKMGVMLLACYGLLWALQLYVDYRLSNSNHADYSQWNTLMQGKVNARMVFLGNSRTEAHFDPVCIEKNTGISGHNLGLSGLSMSEEQIIWKSYLAHNQPAKIVVQNVDLYALTKKPLAHKALYLPYYNDKVLLKELKKSDATVAYEQWIPMSKYRGFETDVLRALGILGIKKTTKIKGHLQHKENWNNDFSLFKAALQGKKINYSTTEIAHELAALKEIIADCHQLQSQLILVWAPQYDELTALQEPTFSEVKKQIKQLAQENPNVVFWDFSTQSFTKEKTNFYNSFHMNHLGVAVFYKQFSDSLNVHLKKPIP